MTGPAHYRAAEDLLITTADAADWEAPTAQAQVHATLALAAAIYDTRPAEKEQIL